MFFETIIMSILSGLMVSIAHRKDHEDAIIVFFLMFFLASVLGFFIGIIAQIILVLTIAFYYLMKKHFKNDPGPEGYLAFFFLMAMIIIFYLIFISLPSTIEIVESRNETLEKLRGGSSSEGGFFLGTGTINNNEYYVYYYLSGSELLQEKVNKNKNVHIFVNEAIEKPVVRYYEVYEIKELSGIMKFIYGDLERLLKMKQINFFIPSDSLMQGVDI